MNTAFESIKQGLTEAIDFAQGKTSKAVVHSLTLTQREAVRQKIGMSQSEFASAFGISLGTLRHWERGDRKPRGPALVLLNVVAKEPRVVFKALSAST